MPATIKDIAMLIGVSRQAVASVLGSHSNSRVAPATREKILRLAQELNYVPNAAARVLNGVKTHAIGILASSTPTIHSMYLYEICQILTTRGYKSFIEYYNGLSFSLNTSLAELTSRGVDGIIVMQPLEPLKKTPTDLNIPCVFALHELPFYDISIDNELTGYLGTHHLLKHGHRRVHYLQIAPLPHHCSQQHLSRQQGWQRAHAEHDIPTTEKMVFSLNQFSGSGKELIRLLIKEKVTALFATNDYLAAKVMKCLFEHGIRIPEDIAMVGCDGYSFTEFTPVSLTTIIPPIHSVAMKIVNLMLERIEGNILNAPPAGIKIPPRLLPGGSCGCQPRPIEQLYQINTMGFLENDYRINFNHDISEDCL